MTGSVAAITITGTIYGASLKGDTEVTKVRDFTLATSFPFMPIHQHHSILFIFPLGCLLTQYVRFL